MSGGPDDLKTQRICRAVREGSPYTIACQLSGISTGTLNEWKRKGRSGIEPYANFYRRLREAEAMCAEDMVGVVKRAAEKGDVKAAMWWLERRFPELFGANREKEAKPIESLSDDELKAALESALEKMKASNE